MDEIWLPDERLGDQLLDEAIYRIASGAELRPGLLLSEFSIEWVVIAGQESPLDQLLESQLDLIPTPLAGEWKVYENSEAEFLAVGENALVWDRRGTGFGGEPAPGPMRISVNYSDGWRPEPAIDGWRVTVSATEGTATFSGGGDLSFAPNAAVGLLFMALVSLIWGKTKR